jgi:hypothetical protein
MRQTFDHSGFLVSPNQSGGNALGIGNIAMTRYWLTTHWPPLPDGRDILNVYLQEHHRNAVAGMAPGDRLLIYEYLSGPDLLKPDGTIVRRKAGRGGIICDARISTGLKPRSPEDAPEEYTDGRKANWAWIAETDDRKFGFLERQRTNAVLGYDEGYKLYGFNRGRGIIQLTPDEYAGLTEQFKSASNG